KYHLLLCEEVDGAEAERIGLVSLCVPEEELEERALEIARRLAAGSQAAISHTKLSLNEWLLRAGPIFDASLELEFLDLTGPDVSPRGDPAGFVRILDERTLLLPDRPGNKLADTLTNLLEDDRIALLFLIPGVNDTFRVNGRARIVDDPELLAASEVDGKAP